MREQPMIDAGRLEDLHQLAKAGVKSATGIAIDPATLLELTEGYAWSRKPSSYPATRGAATLGVEPVEPNPENTFVIEVTESGNPKSFPMVRAMVMHLNEVWVRALMRVASKRLLKHVAGRVLKQVHDHGSKEGRNLERDRSVPDPSAFLANMATELADQVIG
jgi:hypothetical protein